MEMKRLCVRSPTFMLLKDFCERCSQGELCLVDAHGSHGLNKSQLLLVQIEMAVLTLQHYCSLMRRSMDIFYAFLKALGSEITLRFH